MSRWCLKKLDLTTLSSWRLGRAGWPRWQTLAWPGMCTLMRPTGKEAQENVNCFQFFSFSYNLLLLIPSLLISPSVPSANKVDGPRVNEGLPLHIKVRCLGFRGESFHLPPSFSDNSDQSTSFFQSIFFNTFLPPGADVGAGNPRQLPLSWGDAREVRLVGDDAREVLPLLPLKGSHQKKDWWVEISNFNWVVPRKKNGTQFKESSQHESEYLTTRLYGLLHAGYRMTRPPGCSLFM